MSSIQVNYPERILLQGKGVNLSRNLKKGPQKETISLESFNIQLKRSDQVLQPVITAETEVKVDSLSLSIPLNEIWTPLIHQAYSQAYTSLYLCSKNRPALLQICQNPKTAGLVKIILASKGKSLQLNWIIDRCMEAQEELILPPIHFTQHESKITPMRYAFKDRPSPSLNRGRLLTFPGAPTVQRVSEDLKALSDSKLSFDFYALDYGAVPIWGDWMNLMSAFMEKGPSLADEIRRRGMIPGICLAPLTAEKKSIQAQNGFILGKGPSKTIKTGGKTKKIFALDITREEVRDTLQKTLDLYTGWGFKYLHLDHLDLLLENGSWQDESRGPLDRFRLLTRILEPYRRRGVIFSASGLPLMGGMEHFDMVSPSMLGRGGKFSSETWKELSQIIETGLTLKNPPLLSLGGVTFSKEIKKVVCRHKKIYQDIQALMNGPAILAEEYEKFDETVLSQWKELSTNKKPNLLPLDFSPLGLSQNALLLMNRQKNVAICNLSVKKKTVRLLEGELGDYKGLSPSQSTALRSRELILPMRPESSHLFQA